ncbi:hypothetical protein [Telluria aromaticivorans]|uniref:Uncharacterized protein n=1 Tax=Telluria aromaticivorans TaxID=2725995 RepID=A0A7Y2P2T7_9BURK|nr:hypothetical protein [Telluria aromaticivorans]NNG25274.1 hypothetical protein [Telluria aromaticivorans]
MKEANKKKSPGWSDVKTILADFDRARVLALLQDLYSSSKENQAFLHARFGLGTDPLLTYKTSISRWIWPDVSRAQDISIAKAKKAIGDYKKAVGRPDELAELMTFYCEQAVGFCREVGLSDEDFFASLMGMFALALKSTTTLTPAQRTHLLARLHETSRLSHDLGYGLGDEMDELMNEYRDVG